MYLLKGHAWKLCSTNRMGAIWALCKIGVRSFFKYVFSIDDSKPIGKKINTFAICGGSFLYFLTNLTLELNFDLDYDLESL